MIERLSLNREAKAEARLRELIARRPSQPISTREVKVAFEHPALRLEENRVRCTVTGAEGKRLRIRPGEQSMVAATVIPLLDEGRMALVARYRYAPGKWNLELPRGHGYDADATWSETAQRILAHEGGLVAQTIRLLGATNSDPRLMSVGEIVVLAEGCVYQPELARNDNGLIAGTLDVEVDAIDRLIRRGTIDCGASLAAICLYRAQLAR